MTPIPPQRMPLNVEAQLTGTAIVVRYGHLGPAEAIFTQRKPVPYNLRPESAGYVSLLARDSKCTSFQQIALIIARSVPFEGRKCFHINSTS